jgi:hypothetical protein
MVRNVTSTRSLKFSTCMCEREESYGRWRGQRGKDSPSSPTNVFDGQTTCFIAFCLRGAFTKLRKAIKCSASRPQTFRRVRDSMRRRVWQPRLSVSGRIAYGRRGGPPPRLAMDARRFCNLEPRLGQKSGYAPFVDERIVALQSAFD